MQSGRQGFRTARQVVGVGRRSPVTPGITTRPPTRMIRVRALSRTVFAFVALALAVFVRDPEARRSIRNAQRVISTELRTRVGGPLYFPFQLSMRRPLRAFQGYLTNSPRALVAAIPELEQVASLASRTAPTPEDPGSPRQVRSVPCDVAASCAAGRLRLAPVVPKAAAA